VNNRCKTAEEVKAEHALESFYPFQRVMNALNARSRWGESNDAAGAELPAAGDKAEAIFNFKNTLV